MATRSAMGDDSIACSCDFATGVWLFACCVSCDPAALSKSFDGGEVSRMFAWFVLWAFLVSPFPRPPLINASRLAIPEELGRAGTAVTNPSLSSLLLLLLPLACSTSCLVGLVFRAGAIDWLCDAKRLRFAGGRGMMMNGWFRT